MIRAKQPNVVISCFKTETSNALVQNLRCRRLGSSFHYDPRGSKQLAESGLSLIRVNAFHPSYAINYNPEFSCFKRLLVLEFTKAFALWRNDWNDLDWMSLLRYECKGNLKRYVSQILNELLWNRFILAEVDNSCDQFLKRRWATLLGNLATDFEKCFFSECGSAWLRIPGTSFLIPTSLGSVAISHWSWSIFTLMVFTNICRRNYSIISEAVVTKYGLKQIFNTVQVVPMATMIIQSSCSWDHNSKQHAQTNLRTNSTPFCVIWTCLTARRRFYSISTELPKHMLFWDSLRLSKTFWKKS